MEADANKKPKAVPLAERLANIEEARRLRQVKRELDAVSRREKRIARRKKRKENKARANKEEDERQAIRKTIQSATTSGMNPNNPWGNCY